MKTITKRARAALRERLDRQYDMTQVAHVPRTRSVPLMSRSSPPLMIDGYELVALIAHQKKQVDAVIQAIEDLEAILYDEEGEACG